MYVKVCGATSIEDAVTCTECGADAIGLNLIPSSKRFIDVGTARSIVRALSRRVPCVGVVAGYSLSELLGLQKDTELDALQLHGGEPSEWLTRLGAPSYLAARISTADDVNEARGLPGALLLTDARVQGALGGTGHSFDWDLVVELARQRPLVLAGGLHPGNVAAAVQRVSPHAVDVASGVESPGEPRKKSPALVERFVRQAKEASSTPASGGFLLSEDS